MNRTSWYFWLAATFLSCAVSLSCGISYGDNYSNQSTYVTPGLYLFDGEYLEKDWWFASSAHYHKAFTWLVWGVSRLGDPAYGLAALNAATIAAGLLAVFWIIREIKIERSINAFMMFLLLFRFLFPQETVGDSYIFSASLQPSTISSSALIWAIVLFARGKFTWSGLALGISGAFHANFAVVSVPFFVLAHLLLGTRGLTIRALSQFAIPVLVLAAWAPTIMGFREENVDLASESYRILTEIAVPFHYNLSVYRYDLIEFAGWTLLAGAAWVVVAPWFGMVGLPVISWKNGAAGSAALQRLAVLHVSLLTGLAINFIVLALFDSPLVNRVFLWRMAPFGLVVGMFPITVATVRVLNNDNPELRGGHTFLTATLCALGAICLILSYYWLGRPSETRMLVALGWIIALTLVVIIRWRGRFESVDARRWLRIGGGLGVAIVLITTVSLNLKKKDFTFAYPKSIQPELDLYTWIHAETPTDSLFLIPPGLQQFRLRTGRAVVVDWKAIPLQPDLLVEWEQRMMIATGLDKLGRLKGANNAYHELDERRLKRVLTAYGPDYAVVRIPNEWPDGLADTVFENVRFRVIDLNRRSLRTTE